MTIGVRYTANTAGLNRLLRDPNGPLGQYMLRLGNRVANNARRRAPVRTGLLRSSITVSLSPLAPLTVTVAARRSYARYVHDGTRFIRSRPFLLDALREEINR